MQKVLKCDGKYALNMSSNLFHKKVGVLGWAWRSIWSNLKIIIVAVVSGILRLNILVEVLSNPSESFPVALPLKHGAHEHLQGPSVQL